jgi:hypothetical protein
MPSIATLALPYLPTASQAVASDGFSGTLFEVWRDLLRRQNDGRLHPFERRVCLQLVVDVLDTRQGAVFINILGVRRDIRPIEERVDARVP